MKKVPAIFLLIIGAIIGWFVLWYGGYWLYLFTELNGGLVWSVIMFVGAEFGIDCLRRFYTRKYSLPAPLFMLCAYAPAAACVIPSLIVMISRNDKYYRGKFMSGFSYAYDQVYTPVASVALVVGALLWLGVSALRTKKERKLK